MLAQARGRITGRRTHISRHENVSGACGDSNVPGKPSDSSQLRQPLGGWTERSYSFDFATKCGICYTQGIRKFIYSRIHCTRRQRSALRSQTLR
jgi:hypothetical protein